MTLYPVMPSRAGTDGLGARSYYDEVYLPENRNALEWTMDGMCYCSHLIIRLNGKCSSSEARAHRQAAKSSRFNQSNDNKACPPPHGETGELYKASIEWLKNSTE
jgi:hypothetical protein